MEVQCGCHCIKCNSTKLESKRIGKTEENGYFDMHHACKECDTHFDHLEGETFDSCKLCNYKTNWLGSQVL